MNKKTSPFCEVSNGAAKRRSKQSGVETADGAAGLPFLAA
jgi:hypothetical protein